MELDYKAIGQRKKNQRFKQEMSQELLAELDGLSVTHSSHIENGNTKVSLPSLVKIANALGVSLDDLVCDSIIKSKIVYDIEIAQTIEDCTEWEIRIIADVVKAVKASLRCRIKSDT